MERTAERVSGVHEVSHEEFNNVMGRLVALLDEDEAEDAFRPLLAGVQSKATKPVAEEKGLWGLQAKDKCEWITEESVALPLWLLLLVMGSLVFSNSLHGDFVLDDTALSFFNTSRIWTNQQDHGSIVTSSFQLSYWFQGLIPSGFRLMNVLLHGLASVLVYFTAQLLFGADKTASAWAALFFVVHPIHTEAVNYISARGHILQAVFYLLSFLAYSRAATKGVTTWVIWYLLSLACCVASTMCGGMGATVLVLNALYDLLYYFNKEEGLKPRQKQLRNCQPVIWRIIGMVYVGGMALTLFHLLGSGEDSQLLRLSQTDNFVRYSAAKGDTFFLQRWWTLLQVAGAYLSLLIWPSQLSLDHSPFCPPFSEDGTQSASWLSYLALPLTAGMIGWFYLLHHQANEAQGKDRQHQHQQQQQGASPTDILLALPPRWRAVLPLAWLLVPLAVVSNWVWYTPHLLIERAAYLPSVGFCLVLAWGLWAFRRAVRRRLSGTRGKMASTLVTVGCLLLLAMYSMRTLSHNTNWATEDQLLRATSQSCNGSSAIVSMYRGRYLEGQGNRLAALHYYREALGKDPSLTAAVFRLAKASLLDGNYTQTLRELSPIVNAYPAMYHPSVFHDAGVCFLELGDYERAVKFFSFVIKSNSTVTTGREYISHAHSNLAVALLRLRRFAEALKHAESAVVLDGNHPAYRNNLGVLYALVKRLPQARDEFHWAAIHHGHKEAKLNHIEVEHKIANPSHSLSLDFSIVIQP